MTPFSPVHALLTGDRIALFVDFDGTLVEIGQDLVRPEAGAALRWRLEAVRTALEGAAVLVCGCPLGELDRVVGPVSISAVGDQGNELRLRGGAIQPMRATAARAAEALRARLRLAFAGDARMHVRRRGLSVLLAFPHAPQLRALAENVVYAMVEPDADWIIDCRQREICLHPRGAGKGEIVTELMRLPAFVGRRPVFIGDDRSDEAGFAAAQRLGGFGIKVGRGRTVARFRLSDCAAVATALDVLAARPQPLRVAG